jgi:hypothetical protein
MQGKGSAVGALQQENKSKYRARAAPSGLKYININNMKKQQTSGLLVVFFVSHGAADVRSEEQTNRGCV